MLCACALCLPEKCSSLVACRKKILLVLPCKTLYELNLKRPGLLCPPPPLRSGLWNRRSSRKCVRMSSGVYRILWPIHFFWKIHRFAYLFMVIYSNKVIQSTFLPINPIFLIFKHSFFTTCIRWTIWNNNTTTKLEELGYSLCYLLFW